MLPGVEYNATPKADPESMGFFLFAVEKAEKDSYWHQRVVIVTAKD